MRKRGAIISFDFSKEAATLIGDRYQCYVDETNDDISGLCGAGLLVTTTDVQKNVVEQALLQLQDDPDRARPDRVHQDDATLQRRFFHASADSANAHSHLCTSIRNNVEGLFICSLFDAKKVRQERRWAKLEDTDFQNAAWALAADFTTSGATAVDFMIEDRARLGSTGEKWIDAFYRRRDWERFNLKGQKLPIAYPPMSCEVGPKTAPGLQAADFLLWAALRSINGKSDWANRVGLSRSYFLPNEESGIAGQYVFSLGTRSLDLPLLEYNDDTLDSFKMEIAESLLHWQNKCLAIEWLVCLCAKARPVSVTHLMPSLQSCMGMLNDDGGNCSSACIEHMATMYLRLFDTVPAYGAELAIPKETIRILYEARDTAALVIRKDQTASRYLVGSMCRFRKYLQQNDAHRLPYNGIWRDAASLDVR